MGRLILLVLAGVVVAISDVKSGSAVAMENAHGKMVSSYGHPKAIAIQVGANNENVLPVRARS
jgi:hypothetical protein